MADAEMDDQVKAVLIPALKHWGPTDLNTLTMGNPLMAVTSDGDLGLRIVVTKRDSVDRVCPLCEGMGVLIGDEY